MSNAFLKAKNKIPLTSPLQILRHKGGRERGRKGGREGRVEVRREGRVEVRREGWVDE